MTFYDDSGYGRLMAQRSRNYAVEQNAGRTARVTITWTSIGIGETMLKTARPLNVTFIEEPSFTTGMVLDASTDLVPGNFPRAQAGVYEWHKDADGHYVGAYLFFTVDLTGSGSTVATELATVGKQLIRDQPNYVIHHHMVFEGKAIKNLPGHLLDL